MFRPNAETAPRFTAIAVLVNPGQSRFRCQSVRPQMKEAATAPLGVAASLVRTVDLWTTEPPAGAVRTRRIFD